MIFVLLGAVFLWIFYKYWTSIYKHWEVRSIPFIPGSFPFGSMSLVDLIWNFQGYGLDKVYYKVPSPYVGIYLLRTPFLVIRDPDIIKLVLAKDFSHFRDRQGFNISKEDVVSHHLFNLEGDRWKAVRVKLSPTFSSGKLKAMFPLFLSCAEALNSLLLSQVDTVVNMKDVVARFTTDTICSSALGIESNSTKSMGRDLRDIGKNVTVYDWMTRLQKILMLSFPSFSDLGCFRLVSKDVEETLIKFIENAVEFRKKNNVIRHDFLDLLIQLKEKGKLNDDHDEPEHQDANCEDTVEMNVEMMAAQTYVFFVAGFETSSSVQSYCLYELALNPDIQERLYKEIDSTIKKHGDLTYQAIQEMEYLDMVVSETTRKYPTLPTLTRRCTKPFSMPAGNRIEKGDRLVIPVWQLHHDPQYFPNPDLFDPERFSKENKEKIKPHSYLPFGEGPRTCIGMRFGLLQTKVGLITVLRKFEVSPSEKTVVPLKFKQSLVVTDRKSVV